jgi:cyanophycin synthetase
MQFGDRVVHTRQGAKIAGAHGVLLHPWTEIAICEAGAETILTEGLGFDRCQIGVVLNVGHDELGLAYIDTLDQMAKVKRCVVDVVLPTGTAVLNADDEIVADMAEYCKGSVVFFTREKPEGVVLNHLETGGRVVLFRDEFIYLTEGGTERLLMPINEVAMPTSGYFDFHIEDILAAVGTAWSFGLDDELISEGLRTFPGKN